MSINQSYFNKPEFSHRQTLTEQNSFVTTDMSNHRRRNSHMQGLLYHTQQQAQSQQENELLQRKLNQLKGLKLFSQKPQNFTTVTKLNSHQSQPDSNSKT